MTAAEAQQALALLDRIDPARRSAALRFMEFLPLDPASSSRATHPWVKRAAQRVEQWTILDDDYAVGEFQLRLHGWDRERRFAVIREQVREGCDSVGRKLIEVPGYTFRVFVTSCADPPQEIWRGDNRRADMENRIAELKHDLGAMVSA